MPEILSATPPDIDLADLRRQLIANGYLPIPAVGKKGCSGGWSSMRMTAEDVDEVIRDYPFGTNTGLLTGEIVAIDIDTPDHDTAAHLTALAMGLPDAGQALQRVGKAPKVTFVFRATTPRQKVVTSAYRIGGEKCQIEVLGAGQQFIAFGVHPETNAP